MMIRLLLLFMLLVPAYYADNGMRLSNNEGVNQTNLLFMRHRILAEGEISNHPQPVIDGTPATVWQADCYTRWPDGSAKACYVTWQATVASGGNDYVTFQNATKTCYLTDQAACTAAIPTKQNLLDWDTGGGTGSWGAKIGATAGGVTEYVSGRTMLNSCGSFSTDLSTTGCKQLAAGPLFTYVVVEAARTNDFGWNCPTGCVINDTSSYETATWENDSTAGDQYRHLHPGFTFQFFKGVSPGTVKSVRTRYWLHNGLTGDNTNSVAQWFGDQYYDLEFFDGAAETNSIFTQADVVHMGGVLLGKTFWQGDNLESWDDAGTRRLRSRTDWNMAYMVADVKAFPSYDYNLSINTGVGSEWKRWTDTYSYGDGGGINGSGGLSRASGTSPATNIGVDLETTPTGSDEPMFLHSMKLTATEYEKAYQVLWDLTTAGGGGNANVLVETWRILKEFESDGTYCPGTCTGSNLLLNAQYRFITRDNSLRNLIYTFSLINSANGASKIHLASYRSNHWLSPDTLHAPDYNFLSWALHGDWYWMQQQQGFAAYFHAVTTPASGETSSPFGCRATFSSASPQNCSFGKYGYSGQAPRGAAVANLALARAAWMAPEGSAEKELFTGIYEGRTAITMGKLNVRLGSLYQKNSGGTESDPCPCASFDVSTSTPWCLGYVQLGYSCHTPAPNNVLGFIYPQGEEQVSTVIYGAAEWNIASKNNSAGTVGAHAYWQQMYYLAGIGAAEAMGFDFVKPLRLYLAEKHIDVLFADDTTGYPCAVETIVDSYQMSLTAAEGFIQITSATNTNPVQFTTSAAHGFSTNDNVHICCGEGDWAAVSSANVAGATITVIDSDTFSIPFDSSALSTFGASQDSLYVGLRTLRSTQPLFTSLSEALEYGYAKYEYDGLASRYSADCWRKNAGNTAYQRVHTQLSYPQHTLAASVYLGGATNANHTGSEALTDFSARFSDAIPTYFADLADKPRFAMTEAGLTGYGASYYASPSGSGTTCTFSSPCSLDTGLTTAGPVTAGDTLWLRGGKYGSGDGTYFPSSGTPVSGTVDAQVFVRPYPGAKVVIDGGIDITNCSYVTIQDLWFTNTGTTRTGDWTTSDYRAGAINLRSGGSGGCKAVRNVIGNCGHPGIGLWSQSDGGEAFGNLIFGCGLFDSNASYNTDRGSAIYMQTATGNGQVVVDSNLAFWNYTTGGKAYAEGAEVDNILWTKNTAFENAKGTSSSNFDHFLAKNGTGGADNIVYTYNNVYQDPTSSSEGGARLGYNRDNGSLVAQNNYIVSGHFGTTGLFLIERWGTLDFQNNTAVSGHSTGRVVHHRDWQTGAETVTWDNNSYFHSYSTPFNKDETMYNFADWKTATGWDTNSTATATLPTTNVVKVIPTDTKYADLNGGIDTGFVVVYNWESSASVSVDLSSILESGDLYQIWDAQCVNTFVTDSCVVVESGTYTGGSVSITLGGTATSTIYGTTPSMPHTDSKFEAFYVVPAPGNNIRVSLGGTFSIQ